MKAAVVFCALLFALLVESSDGSLLPFMDPAGSGSFPLMNQLLDSFRVLEQMPLGLDREDTLQLLPPPPARVDWKETPENHVIMLDVPGLNKEELKIEMDDNRILKVIGERKREEEKKGDHWHRLERCYGKFWRQFRLPDNVDLDSVKAKLENGVLTLTLSKLSPDKIKGPRLVSIAAEEPAAKLKSNDAKQEL